MNSIEQIKARWLKATPGPWSADCQPGDCVVWGPKKITVTNAAHHVKEVFLCNIDNGETGPVAFDLEKENAEAIANAPDDIVFLLSEIDQLNVELTMIKAAHSALALASAKEDFLNDD